VSSEIGRSFSVRDLGRHVLKDIPVPEHLFQVDVPGRRVDFPPLRIADATTGNLPERLTSFVGRSRELDELRGLLDANRLVTLTGPGGIGKTSLAVELARDRASTVPDGAWFVALEAVSDPTAVGTAIARSLGLFDGVERQAADALPGFLAGRSVLLVLDNFEQVVDAAGDVASLLRASPGSRFIVTSRAPLHLAGEQEYAVRPLPVDGATTAIGDPPDASTRLFIDRARAVRPGWEPGPDAPIVAEVCALLDGLPLGIELAAARVSVLPMAAIRDRLASRSPLPGSGPRDGPARQRTLESAIEWSHDLLAPADQRTLHDLGVFEGTFDARQVERVVSRAAAGEPDIVERLVTLAERSLLTRDVASIGMDARLEAMGIRFGMLRTVQGFAVARVVSDGREAEVRDRHALAYLGLVEAAEPNLNSGRQPAWLDRLVRDDPNISAAIRWSIAAGDVEIAQRFLAALWRYWLLTGRLGEAAQWVEAILAMPGADVPTHARMWALSAAGGIAYWRADREATDRWYQAEFDLATEIGDEPGIADACANLASARFVGGDPAASLDLALEARRRFVTHGDERSVNRMDWGLGNIRAAIDGSPPDVAEVQRILVRAQELDDAPYVAMAESSVAWATFMLGDVATAGRWMVRAMLGNYALRDVASGTVGLPIGAVIALETGRPRDAAMILGAFESMCERYGVRPPVGLAALIGFADPLERARQTLDPATFADAFARGGRMSLGEAIDLIAGLADAIPAGPPSTPPAS
jgi:predicted ATPase